MICQFHSILEDDHFESNVPPLMEKDIEYSWYTHWIGEPFTRSLIKSCSILEQTKCALFDSYINHP